MYFHFPFHSRLPLERQAVEVRTGVKTKMEPVPVRTGRKIHEKSQTVQVFDLVQGFALEKILAK